MRPVRRPRFTIRSANPNSNPRAKLRSQMIGTDRRGAGSHHDLHHSRLRSNPLSSEKVSGWWRISGKKSRLSGPRAGNLSIPQGHGAWDGTWEPQKTAAGQREKAAPKRKTPDGRGGRSGVGIAAAIECAYAMAISVLAGGDPLRGARHPRAASPRNAAPE
jgi:hypothetical protein